MKNNNILVSSLPVKPQQITNVGMMLGPTVMDFLGDVLDCNKMLSFNTLHTYNDKNSELELYVNDINKSGINYDKTFVDSDCANELLNCVQKMIYDKEIVVKNKIIYRCECGMVDLEKSAINKNAKLYSIKNDKIVCKHCNCECKEYKQKSLVLEVKNNVDCSIVPNYLNSDIKAINDTFLGNDILISKGRKTGYSLLLDGIVYNIDIDFLWSNYFKIFNEQMQIYIASNHQLFAMFLMNYISKISSNKDLYFVATPYLNVDLNKAWDEYNSNELKEFKKLLLLYNLRWKNKNCNWDESISCYLNNISNTKLKNLYLSMIVNSKDYLNYDDISYSINNLLNKSTNMQNNIKIMKKYFKDGML